MLIYLKLFLYVRQIGLRATSIQTMFRARRELIMVRRIFIIIIFLLIIGLPYCIFVFMSFITNPPKYYYRISLFFVDIGQTFIMIALFCFSQPLMDIIQKFGRLFVNIVQPTTTWILGTIFKCIVQKYVPFYGVILVYYLNRVQYLIKKTVLYKTW